MPGLSAPPVLFVHIGPTRHGVTRYGTKLAGVGGPGGATRSIRLPDAAATGHLDQTCRRLRPAVCHFHFTDQIYADDPEGAAARFGDLVDVAGPAITVVTLHDVPPLIGERQGRRRAAYRDVVERADAVIVSSGHEADRVRGFAGAVPTVIPHYVETRRVCRSVAGRPSVGVLGYLYPGKGHDAVIAAAGRLEAVDVVAIGGPASRHALLADELRADARSTDVRLEITGWVADDRLDACLADATVAVVPNEDISASGSLATWLGAHRRPLVRSGPYALELAARAPGCMTLYDGHDPDALRSAIAAAIGHPSSTRQDCVPDELRLDRIAGRHASLFARLA